MAEFKKSGGFRKNNHGGGGGFKPRGDRPSFGHKGGFGGGSQGGERPQLFDATCATCGKSCQVPFKPNGMKPVFCRDCFGDKRDTPRNDSFRSERNDRNDAPRYSDRNPAPRREEAPRASANDAQIESLKRQIDAVHNKLDVVIEMMKALQMPAPVVVVSEPVKKAAKPKAPKKK